MKVSVIIPCYNAECYLEKCIESLLNDKLSDKELIFINDGSKDNTLNKLKKFQKKYNNIIIINQENSGQGVARNKGLKKAKGEYIFFLDVDDYIEKNALYNSYSFAKKHKSDYVYFDYYEHYHEKDVIIKNYITDDEKKNAVLANFAPWGKLIKKSLIDNINFKFLEHKIYEDVAVIPFLAASSNNPKYLNEPLYYYNMTNMSTTRKKEYDKKYEDMIYVSDYLYNLFKKHDLLESYYEEIQYIFLDSILKSGVLKLAKYKEGLPIINKLRKNVKSKFKHLLKNKYYKKEKIYYKFTTFISLYFPSYLLYIMKKIKK